MDILFERDRFFIGDPQKPQAEITFHQVKDGQIEVDHTFVDESLRGQGIAGKLVEAVAHYAREQGLKVSATCSYAHKVLQHERYSDIFAA